MKKGLLLLAVLVCSLAADSQTIRNTRPPGSRLTSPKPVDDAVSRLPSRRVIL